MSNFCAASVAVGYIADCVKKSNYLHNNVKNGGLEINLPQNELIGTNLVLHAAETNSNEFLHVDFTTLVK